jgi:hypothetical protein
VGYKIRLNDRATLEDIRTIINIMDLVHNGRNVEQVELLKSLEGIDLIEDVPQTLVFNNTENEATIDQA